MKSKTHLILTGAMVLVATAAIPASAQSQNIQARISGGGGNGKCTVEVVVQGSADVEIRGNQGNLRTLSGNPAQWRRLDCNQPLPANPSNFKFAGVDGHGRQGLSADPNSNNGVAVIHIENTTGSNEGYTADITWNGGNNSTSDVWVPGNGNTNGNWNGQSQNIRARISGGGGGGKCTFEVALSGTAEIQIQGDQGNLRTLSGNQAQWRRLDCNQPLPRQPGNLRLSGVDGRGQQSLTQNPGTNNGVAVVRIQNTTGGTEGFTGDITWDGGNDTSDYRWGTGNSSSNENWNGQLQNIRANISGASGGSSGKCTFEVALNGTAEIQIQDDQGSLRTLTGSPAQWRRLDCNQVLPRQPGNLRFSGSGQYGQQSQTQNPSTNSGITVFRIDNSNRGNQDYTGTITWNGGNGTWGNNGAYTSGEGNNNWDQRSATSAVQGCQDTVTARLRLDHKHANDIQISQDNVRVSRGSNDSATIQGAGLYRSKKNGNSRQFTYNCVYNTRSGQLTQSTYQ
jgi:hypothetical protein